MGIGLEFLFCMIDIFIQKFLMPYLKRKSNRLKGYDYAKNNKYFITVCVKNNVCCLGEIKNKEMILNEYGRVIERQWLWLKEKYPYVILHNYVVMPNHFHAILGIKIPAGFHSELGSENFNKIKSISEIVGAFKSTSSKHIHLLGFTNFQWHRSFYESVIPNETALYNISEYIINNPSNWKYDSFGTFN